MDRRHSELAQFGLLLTVRDVADVLRLSPNRVRGLLAHSWMNARLSGVCATTACAPHDPHPRQPRP
jgi:hypothetical protein